MVNSYRPIPDLWIQKIKYLQFPGYLSYSHLITPKWTLRPYYRDVAIEPYPQISLEQNEIMHLTEYHYIMNSNLSPLRNIKKSSSNKKSSSSKSNEIIEPYTKYYIKGISTYVSVKLAERIIREFCYDVDYQKVKLIDFSTPCAETIREQKRLIARRYYETKLVESLEKEEAIYPFFAVTKEWISEWALYTQYYLDDDRIINRFLYDQFPPPKSIQLSDNNDENQLIPAPLFQTFVTLYGCDKIVGRENDKFESKEVNYTGKYLTEDQLRTLERVIGSLENDVSDEQIAIICTEEHTKLRESRQYEDDEDPIEENNDDNDNEKDVEDEEEVGESRNKSSLTDNSRIGLKGKNNESKLSSSTLLDENSNLIEMTKIGS